MIRNAEHSDIRPLAELWARAFPGERNVESRVRHLETGGVFGGIETAWIDERAGRIAGAFRAYALTQHMHGTPFRMMGLAAVAVDETARRRGIGRDLCVAAIRSARERGDVLSMLYPFRPAFYHSLGWAMTGELHAYRFRPESLGEVGRGAVVSRAGPDDTAAIAACYDRVAVETNGMIARTPRIWRSHLEGQLTHTYVIGDGSVRGYLIVRFGRSSAPDDKPLYVREIVAADHDAYEGLLGWLSAQRDSWRIIHYEAAPDERLAHRLSDPRAPGFHPARYLWAPVARVLRGPMLRILDVRAAIERRIRWAPVAPVSFGLHVLDELVPENEGPFEVDYDGSRVALKRGTARPTLRLPVTTLAQVYAGELSIREAVHLGLAECDGDASAIDALFRVDRCFRLLDEF
ncbi:MAG TPA: GNAT family N-acetyltransferase [Longimicrobiales bacterium]|nr:GNAT family N-acetyltransferase [Longimicrobiales bacterium]